MLYTRDSNTDSERTVQSSAGFDRNSWSGAREQRELAGSPAEDVLARSPVRGVAGSFGAV
jgi:hypothetical protein